MIANGIKNIQIESHHVPFFNPSSSHTSDKCVGDVIVRPPSEFIIEEALAYSPANHNVSHPINWPKNLTPPFWLNVASKGHCADLSCVKNADECGHSLGDNELDDKDRA